MLHMQSRRRNRRPYSHSLYESMHFVAIDLYGFWCTVVMHSSIRGVLLSWCGSFVGKEENKGLEGCSVVLVLDHMKGEK